ncbi:MAG: c-type cytochrome [Phycisphaerae bacterium]
MLNTFNTVMRMALSGAGIAVVVVLTGCGKGGSSNSRQTPQAANNPSVAAPAPKPVAMVGDATKGKQLFADNCSTCHGDHGQGVVHLGKDLQTSKFVAGLSDAKLVAFIKHGRSTANPLDTTHVAMPPRGGNPALNTQKLYDIVAYIRQLQKKYGAK